MSIDDQTSIPPTKHPPLHLSTEHAAQNNAAPQFTYARDGVELVALEEEVVENLSEEFGGKVCYVGHGCCGLGVVMVRVVWCAAGSKGFVSRRIVDHIPVGVN